MINKRFVVTGGAGFIGSHLVDALLSAGAERVAAVDNLFLGREDNLVLARRDHGDAFRFYRQDASDLTAMRRIVGAERPDVIFNLATKALLHSFVDPVDAFKVNMEIAIVLGELLRAGDYGRLVQISTSEVYGTAAYVPMDEKHPILAKTAYAAGKASADLLLSSYIGMFALDVVILRPFNNYGPRQNSANLAALVPLTIRSVLCGGTPAVDGDGEQTRDFIFVGDTVNAILQLAFHDDVSGRVVNLGSGRETSVNEIVNTLCSLMGYSGEIVRRERRSADVLRHCAGIDYARSLIGEIATTPLHDGLEKTIEWYREHRPFEERQAAS